MIKIPQNPRANEWLARDIQGTSLPDYIFGWLALSEADQEARWATIVASQAADARAQLANLDATLGAIRDARTGELTAILDAAKAVAPAAVAVAPEPVDTPIP